VAAFAVLVATATILCSVKAAAGVQTSVDNTQSWTVYHGDPEGSGVSTSVGAVLTSARAWTSPKLDGEIYGEPVVEGSDIYIATENDTVYALSSSKGNIVWSRHLGTPVPSSALPCGDIRPTLGITGTPVIDASRHEVFVVADEYSNGSPAHVLVGLNTSSGSIEVQQNVDPSGADPNALLQRTGLTLDAGQVVFGMGGNDGDCATYRGRVVAVPEVGGSPRFFTIDASSGDSQGAVWMGGAAPVIDNKGDIWVSVGNGSVYSASEGYDDSDSALELSSSLSLLQYFAPSDWPENNSQDLDMSVPPTLLSNGDVLLTGKSRIAYLLEGSHLGGIGGQLGELGQLCDEDIDGGTAVVNTTVFLPCLAGIVAVDVDGSSPSLHLVWNSNVGGGPPIVAAGLVWTISQEGVLFGLNPSTGKITQQASVGEVANHFPTPSVGDDLMLVPTAYTVVAFRAPINSKGSSPTTASTIPGNSQPTIGSTVSTHGGTSTRAKSSGSDLLQLIIVLVVVVLVVAVLLGVLLLRKTRFRRRGVNERDD
jgi:outer membrane protein assembly factor BamB